MAKATYVTTGGAKVQIDATPTELVEIMKALSTEPATAHDSKARKVARTKESSRPTRPKKSGPTGYVLELKDEGYFRSKRKLADLQAKLEEGGHIYAQTSLSPILIRLTKNRQLRRLKEKGGWVYVNN